MTTKTMNEQEINRDKLIERKNKMKEAVRKGKPKEMKDWEWAEYCKYTRDKTKEIILRLQVITYILAGIFGIVIAIGIKG